MAALTSPSAAVQTVRECLVDKVRHSDGTKTINGYHVQHKLGEGGFAKVKLCVDVASGETFAMKVFRKGRLRRQRQYVGNGEGTGMKIKTALDKVYNEVSLLKGIQHENCTRLFAIFDDHETDGKIYIVIDYVALGASMEWNAATTSYFVPRTQGVVPELVARSYVKDSACALAYLHEMLVAHRDVKPQNLLLQYDGRIILSDFGLAVKLSGDCLVEETQGTFHFFAPEMCVTGYQGHEARKVDMWALGITLWAYLFGTLPFYSQDLANLFAIIGAGQLRFPGSAEVSQAAVDILRRLLDTSCERRLLAAEILQDAWCMDAARDAVRAEIAKTVNPPSA